MIERSKYEELIEGDTSFFFDANILLELYRVSTQTCLNIMGIIDCIRTNAWIPKQAYEEYLNNKDIEKTKQFNKYKNVKKDLHNLISGVDGDIKKRIIQYKKYEYPNIDAFESKYNIKIQELKEIMEDYLSTIDEEVQKNAIFLKSNKIEVFVNNFFTDGRLLKGMNIVDKIEILREGKLRYEYSIPPGYKDIEKPGISAYGDLFLWKEILEYAKTHKENIIFITNDEKEDWWHIEKEALIGPRHELLEEFRQYNSESTLVFLTLKRFFSLTSQYYNKKSFVSELELNADDYIQTYLLKKYDSEIFDALEKYAWNEADYDSVLDYSFNNIDYDGIDFEYFSNEFYLEEDIAQYFITIEAKIYTSHSYKDKEGDSFHVGNVELKILLTVLVEQKVDLENAVALDDLSFTVYSIDVKNYKVKDLSNDFDEHDLYEAEIMDALEEYYKH